MRSTSADDSSVEDQLAHPALLRVPLASRAPCDRRCSCRVAPRVRCASSGWSRTQVGYADFSMRSASVTRSVPFDIRRVGSLVACLAVLVLSSGCSGGIFLGDDAAEVTSSTDATSGVDTSLADLTMTLDGPLPDAPGLCPAGASRCNRTCVDLATNAVNCGACGHACRPGETCTAGRCHCAPDRPDDCIFACVDHQTDQHACGGCMNWCPFDATCSGGQCICPSQRPTLCNHQCVDLRTSVTACGVCGHGCSGLEECVDGQCVCPSQWPDRCSLRCASLQTDPFNCGRCDHRCAPGAACLAGACVCPPWAPDACGDNCFYGVEDALHCGNCATACETACSGGACVGVQNVSPSMQCLVLGDGAVRCPGCLNDCGRPLNSLSRNVLGIDDAVQVSDGSLHHCALRSNGTVWCWGANNEGQLGDGSTTLQSAAPVQVVGLQRIVQISGARSRTCARDDAGTLWCWGENVDRALRSLPGDVRTPIAVLTDVSDISVAEWHLCAIQRGVPLCWGSNVSGVLGRDTTTSAPYTPAPVEVSVEAVQISAGTGHTCMVGADTAVYCWGNAYDGESGTSLSPVTAVFAGYSRSIALMADGTLRAWGRAPRGDGLQTSSPQPVEVRGVSNVRTVSADRPSAVDRMGRVWTWDGAAAAMMPPF